MQKRRLPRVNTYAALLSLMVLLSLFSALLVGGISRGVSVRALKEETKRSFLLRDAALRARFSLEISSYRAIAQALSANPAILTQLTMRTSGEVSDILRFREIIQALSSLRMSQSRGTRLFVYFARTHVVATDQTRYKADEFFARYDEETREVIYAQMARWQHFTLKVSAEPLVYGALSGGQALLFGKGLPYSSAYPFGAALVEVPLAALSAMLMPDEGGAQLVIGEGGELLLSALNDADEALLTEAVLAVGAMSERPDEPVFLEITLLGEPHFVAVSASPADGLRFVTTVPARVVLSGAKSITRATVAVAALAAAIATAVSLLTLSRLYLPIRRLLAVLERRGESRPALSRGSDFEKIHAIVGTVWHENESMQRLIGGMRSLLSEDVLSRLLDQNTVDDEALSESGVRLLDGGYLAALLLEIAPKGGGPTRYALLARATGEVLAQGLFPGKLICVVRPLDQVAVVLYSDRPFDEYSARPALERLYALLSNESVAPPTLSLGHTMRGVRSLGDSCMQAQEALYYALLSGASGIVSHQEMLREGRLFSPEPLPKDAAARADALLSLYAHAVNHGDYLVAYLIARMREGGGDAPQEEALSDMMTLSSAGERLSYLMRYDSGLKRSRPRGAQWMDYLQEAFRDPGLSLSQVAERFGYTSNYVSQMIREETGMGFVECVTRIRLREAARLLRETDMRIADIAQAVGFGHVNSFIRTFSKYHQLTPAKYREREGQGA